MNLRCAGEAQDILLHCGQCLLLRFSVTTIFINARICLQDGPGPAPGPTHCGTGKPDWFNQVVFNASVNGVSQETCRDFGHMSYGLASTFNAAETARAQGVDLYTPNKGRLAAALEFHADLINQAGERSRLGTVDHTPSSRRAV